MGPFLLKPSPILTVTYIGCNMEIRSNMYRIALWLVTGAATSEHMSWMLMICFT